MTTQADADRLIQDLILASPHVTVLHHYLVDVTGDLIAGLVLSQIIYWHRGEKLRVMKDQRFWLAKRREDWWAECRVRPKQFDRAIEILRTKGLVETQVHRFGGFPTLHVWLNLAALAEGVKTLFPKGEERDSRKGKNVVPERDRSLTETTDRDYRQISTTTGKPMVDALMSLPYWKPEPESDALWLAEFSIEHPDFGLSHIIACRDFHDGKRARHKGSWKNRLRNWMRIDTERKAQSDARQAERTGTHTSRGDTSAARQATPGELSRSWDQ